jgi:hypothetical protein
LVAEGKNGLVLAIHDSRWSRDCRIKPGNDLSIWKYWKSCMLELDGAAALDCRGPPALAMTGLARAGALCELNATGVVGG